MDEDQKLMKEAVQALGLDVPIYAWEVLPGRPNRPVEVVLRTAFGVYRWSPKKVEKTSNPEK